MAELLWAIKKGDEVMAKRLLDRGADVNGASKNQFTPLHYAKNEAMVKLLLDHGANVHARDQRECIPLHNAHNEAVVKLLLDHGADVHGRDDTKRTPLHYARTEAMVKLLLDHGADVNARDRVQTTPLHWADNAAKMKLLLDHGADVHARDDIERIPLHLAKNEVSEKLLLDHGADVHARDQRQRTPLHCASDVAMARVLVDRGAQLTAADKDGRNALHHAALYANVELCVFLMSRGLDPNIADNEGDTILTLFRFDAIDGEQNGEQMLLFEAMQEALAKLVAHARLIYEQRVREEHWKKNWPLMNTLTSSGLRPMAVEAAALALEQASLDTSVSLPGIPRDTPAKNIAYLNRAVFGHEGFLREIVSFIPRVRFEVGEGEV